MKEVEQDIKGVSDCPLFMGKDLDLNNLCNKLDRYEKALIEIECYGHGSGFGCGYRCADIAKEVLK